MFFYTISTFFFLRAHILSHWLLYQSLPIHDNAKYGGLMRYKLLQESGKSYQSNGLKRVAKCRQDRQRHIPIDDIIALVEVQQLQCS